MPKEISQQAGSKNQTGFSPHLHCCSLQDAVEASAFYGCKRKKTLSKFMEMKRKFVSTQSYYSSTTPGSGSFPLQNSGTVL